jgi:hypothetical protein
MRRATVIAWALAAACAPYEDVRIGGIPLPADAAACLDAQRAALATVAPGRAHSACLYLPELECALRVPLAEVCPPGGDCAFAGWSAPVCTRGVDPEAELERDAATPASLRVVTGDACPPHEDVFAAGDARACEGSALDPASGACLARLDFTLRTDDEGRLAPEEDDVLPAISGLFAETLGRAGLEAPCDAETDPFDTGRVCVEIEGAGTGTVSAAPFPDPGCARTSSVSPATACDTVELVAGRQITLTASAAACSRLAGWSGACSGDACALTVRPGATCDDNRAVARLERARTRLTVVVEGQGEVRVEPLASACPQGQPCDAICSARSPCVLEVPCGARPTLLAQPASGSALSRWGVPTCGLDRERCPLGPVTSSRRVAVRFARNEQTLRVAPAGVCEERVLGPDGLACGGDGTAPGDCERRVPELAPVELRLDTAQEARVLDWGVSCGALASCEAEDRALSFEMPQAPVDVAPRVGYPTRLRVDGPGTVDGLGPTCRGPGGCPPRDVDCRETTALRASGRDLGGCRSAILGWTVDGRGTCTADPRTCTLPAPVGPRDVTATFGVSVPTTVIGDGEVLVRAGADSVSCRAGACDDPSTAPVFPDGAPLAIEAQTGSPPLCFEGCDAVDFTRGQCTLTNAACRAPSVRFGRRLELRLQGDCRLTAPAPRPRSSPQAGRRCLDEQAVDLRGPSAGATRVYPESPVTLSATPRSAGVEVTSFELCDASGQSCSPGSIPAPAGGRFDLTVPGGSADALARVRCERLFTIEVQVSGPGRVDDDQQGPIQGCRETGGTCVHRAPATASLALSPTADAGARFIRWETVSGPLQCSSVPCTFSPTADLTLRAVFLDEVDLDVSVDVVPPQTAGGRVRSFTTGAPAVTSEVDCPNTRCTVRRLATHSVTLEAFPASGYRFAGFAGPCAGSGATCTVGVLDRDRAVGARFIARRDLAVTVMGGSVSATGLACAGGRCTGTYDHGTQVRLTAAPAQAGTFAYVWGGDCAGAVDAECQLDMTADRSASVEIVRQLLTVDLTVTGPPLAGIRVQSSPAGIDCRTVSSGPCRADFDLSTAVRLDASAVTDTRRAWSGACAGATGGTCTVDAGGSATSLTRTAGIEYVPRVDLEVEVLGDPSARVASTPAGIAGCGIGVGTCLSTFDGGAAVQLEVTGSTLTPSFTGCAPRAGAPQQCDLTLPSTPGASVDVLVDF